MKRAAIRDRHSEIVEQPARKRATYRKTFERTLHQIDLDLLMREMREDADLTQAELAWRVGAMQSVIARLEDAAEKKPNFDREVALVSWQSRERTTAGRSRRGCPDTSHR
ncbi:MAG TPA: hypothetical protein VJN21_03980 [Candidatus Acidoferrales bacterium]|nr:hypothetical protein [Candidatus Acidoferrales bacterium]